MSDYDDNFDELYANTGKVDVLYRLNKIVDTLAARQEWYTDDHSNAKYELGMAISLVNFLINDMEPKNA